MVQAKRTGKAKSTTSAKPAKKKQTGRDKSLANLKPFKKGDPRINRTGLNRRAYTWKKTIKRIMDMTREEAIEYVGAGTKVGRMLKELPPNIPLRDGMVFISLINYGRDPRASMLSIIMDREEGKPKDTDESDGTEEVKLSIPADMLTSDFLNTYRDIMAGGHSEYTFDGGRGGLKSTFISEIITVLLANNKDMHALVLRQVKDTLRESVYSQFTWAVNELGLEGKFRMTTSPMEMTYIPTGQKIYFRGADKPESIKSIKPPFGYIGLLWFEEFDQFRGEAAVRNIEQSALRGGDLAYEFKSWNTPRTVNHWVHRWLKTPNKNRLHTVSNYLNVPEEWLGRIFLDQAEHLKEVNPDAYDHEYMGIANGVGGMVFENVEERAITDNEIKTFNGYSDGIDWGYYPDPFVWSRSYYDKARLTLYIYDEYYKHKKRNKATFEDLLGKRNAKGEIIQKGKGVKLNDQIIADSAEPKSIGDYREWGANIRSAEKGPDSVTYSMKWLQGLAKIVIDPVRAPHHAQEFREYEHERTKDGEIISGYPDKNNHCIDAVRYAHNLVWRRRGQ